MKKIVLSLFVLALTIPLAAQLTDPFYGQQLQNSGFEGEWRNTSSNINSGLGGDGNQSGKDPANWSSFIDAQGSLASTAASASHINQSTDKRPGSSGTYSVQIRSRYVHPLLGIGATPANGNLTTGRINAESMSATNKGNYNFTNPNDSKFHQKITVFPDSFTVWVKYSNDNAAHEARISAILHSNSEARDPYLDTSGREIDTRRSNIVTSAEMNYPKTDGQWERKSIPFTKKTGFGATVPAYMLVTFTTNKTPGTGAARNRPVDVVLVDDVLLIYTPKLETKNISASNVEVTPSQGASVTLTYNLSGTMDPTNGDPSKNKVKIQLSDAGGTFSSNLTENIIGEIEHPGSGVTDSPADLTVTGTIPAGTATGNYKVRLVTTNYPMVDDDNAKSVAVELKYDLVLSKNIDAAGTVSGSGIFASGESMAVTATVNEGYEFVNWTKGGAEVSTAESFSYTMPAENTTFIANFKPIKYTLTLNENNAAYGSISGGISGESYDFNSDLNLQAIPTDADYEFINWTGYGEPETDNPLLFTIPLNGAALTANFGIHQSIVTGLSDLLSTSNTLYSSAIEGSANGQYDAGSKAIFKPVIDAAQAVFDTRDAKLASDLKTATTVLSEALRLFRLSQVGYTDGSTAPVITINVADNQVSVNQVIGVVSTLPLVRVPALDEITEAGSLFTFKEGSSSGLDIAFTATVDGDKKEFNLTPSTTLKPGTRYYVALKNRSTATADGARAGLSAKTFITAADVAALNSRIDEAEVKILDPTPEGQEIGNRVEGSKEKLQDAIDKAKNIANDLGALQTTVDRELTALTSALQLFDDSIIAYDRVGLGVFITVAERVYNEVEEGDKNGDHIPGSKATFLGEINKAKSTWTHPGSTDDELKAAVETLLAAISTFRSSTLKVDYTKLNAAISIAGELIDPLPVEENKHGDHIAGSTEALQDAIEAAEAVGNNGRASQREVDDALLALNEATGKFNKAIVVVDFSALEKLISALEKLIAEAQAVCNAALVDELEPDEDDNDRSNGSYMPAVKSTFSDLIEDDYRVIIGTAVSEADVTAAITGLTNALADFRTKGIVVLYGDLIDLIQEYSLLLASITEGNREGDYKSGTKTAIQLVINAGKPVRDNAKATQNEVNAAAGSFAGLVDVLGENIVTVNRTALTQAITAAEESLEGKIEGLANGNQKAGSIETYEEAIARAKTALANDRPTQTSLNNAVEWLAVATANFANAIVVVDYSLLNAAISNADAITKTANYEEGYTESSREEFEEALKAAEVLVEVEDDTQAEVDAALIALRAAQNGLAVNNISTDNVGLGILTVYPNPADDFITINAADGATVNIYNNAGALIITLEAYSGQFIDISQLISGHYIVKVNNQTVAFIKR